MAQWLQDNWESIVAFITTSLISGLAIIKRFWSVEREVEKIKEKIHENDADFNQIRTEIKEELREIRSDIKRLLERK